MGPDDLDDLKRILVAAERYDLWVEVTDILDEQVDLRESLSACEDRCEEHEVELDHVPPGMTEAASTVIDIMVELLRYADGSIDTPPDLQPARDAVRAMDHTPWVRP